MNKRKLIKYVLEKTYRPYVRWYLSEENIFTCEGFVLKIAPGVFHPAFFYSTKILLSFLTSINVEGKRILELGAGSALISMVMYKKGAIVTASDISKTAIENARENGISNSIPITLVHSDLFDALPNKYFDLIIINPPYYPRDPYTESQYAWYCGRQFEYFKKMFKQLPFHLLPYGKAYMILSEDCDLKMIEAIAMKSFIEMREVYKKKKWFEWNYVYELVQVSPTDSQV